MFKPIFVQKVAANRELCAADRYHVLDASSAGRPQLHAVYSARSSRSLCRTVDTKKKSSSALDHINEIAALKPPCSASPSMRPMSRCPEQIQKISYLEFLSNGFEDVHYFYAKRPLCPEDEIEKIKKQLTDFTFLLYCGRGQFGGVWLVEDPDGQIVALKLIPRKAVKYLATEKAALNIYRDRIKDFEHLVQVYQVGQTRDFFYYTMEAAYSVSEQYYIPVTLGCLLEHCLFSPTDSIHISSDILRGLDCLHSNGLAHRDIKPENIILSGETIKICDLSLITNKERKNTAGTELYVPYDMDDIPVRQYGVDCDLFAVGKILYLLLSNEEYIVNFPYISRDILRSRIAKKLNLIINKACSPSYRDRYPSAHDFLQSLNLCASW